MKIPENLAEKASQFPECSYGANQVTLKLKNGTEIKNVILAWGEEIVKIGRKPIDREIDLPFVLEDIVDLISEI